jgi:tetraacyldisaccharide 4'-kinase
MLVDLAPYSKNITSMNFPDHHFFTPKDVEAINKRFSELPEPKLLITTEKDATRLKSIEGLSKEVRKALYVLPIRIRFLLGKEKMFNDKILSYVQKNSRNSILAKGKDDNKPNNGYSTGDGSRTISFRNN